MEESVQMMQEMPQQSADKGVKVKRAPARRKSSKKAERVVLVRSKRKAAVARASAKAGHGAIRINGAELRSVENVVYRDMMQEPINLSSITKEVAGRLDITVSVQGGGSSGQAQAVRSAIAKAISKFSETDTIRKEYMRYDRSLLVDDYRRVEPKKARGPKARARSQTSYR